MSQRIDKSWLVFASLENFEHDRCVDFFSRRDESFGFEEFRRDAEDRGAWTPIQYYSGAVYFRRSLFVSGGHTRCCKAIGGVVSRSNTTESLRT
jgi:hypothetical protein